mmetsp:Transcript_58546/g.128377  ORF Transcript_58546/g.128377 Transcript_58546/m.128377 type:complete len:223 (+) Transcript_58546:520-1188(+)
MASATACFSWVGSSSVAMCITQAPALQLRFCRCWRIFGICKKKCCNFSFAAGDTLDTRQARSAAAAHPLHCNTSPSTSTRSSTPFRTATVPVGHPRRRSTARLTPNALAVRPKARSHPGSSTIRHTASKSMPSLLRKIAGRFCAEAVGTPPCWSWPETILASLLVRTTTAMVLHGAPASSCNFTSSSRIAWHSATSDRKIWNRTGLPRGRAERSSRGSRSAL